ncbi:MAG: alpha-galactosidase [Verrucomicrobiae bacterium]
MDAPYSSVETIQFFRLKDRLRLTHLCGMPMANAPVLSPRALGLAVVGSGARRFDGDDLKCVRFRRTKQGAEALNRIEGSGLDLRTVWRIDPATGVVSRRDTLTNTGAAPAVITRCLARMAFPSGDYECYSQASRWCHENQGAWAPLSTGVTLRHVPGRTTDQCTPYLALRAAGSSKGVAFHVIPCGNWTIRVIPVTEGGGDLHLPSAVVELGLADENLHLTLKPGESLELPEILSQPLPDGEVQSGAPLLHRYLLDHHFSKAKPEAPVVYNTWFYEFDTLDVPRLRAQLVAAKEAGCEVFVVDAGWYGPGGPNWFAQAGDWREKPGAAFCGRMKAFAGEVRAAGLGFGLWMEPERLGPEAPIRARHPEWFVPCGDSARIDLTCRAARAWLRREIGRLVETYALAWMKVDFNFALDADASGRELHRYSAEWYRLLDEVRTAYPQTFFEGCSSGALRGDLNTMARFDGHFLSDTVNPVDMLRISQGAWLRLPPGRITRWMVVRPAGQAVPRYGMSLADSPQTILTPCGPLWEPAETVDLNFALLASMPGMMGFSGDLAGLSPEHRAQIADAVAFYKAWRRVMTGAAGHLLTPPEPLTRRKGWIGLQLQAKDVSLVFVYRLGNAGAPPPLRLRSLDPNACYTVWRGLETDAPAEKIGGADLMRDGLRFLPNGHFARPGNAAEIFTIRNDQPA